MSPSLPFAAWERALALRYLRSIRAQGGVALIAVISFVAIALAVAALVIVMSIMNGFRSDLFDKMMGFNGHIYVIGGPMTDQATLNRIRAVPGVVSAVPVVEGQTLVQGPNNNAGAILRGMRPQDLRATAIIMDHLDPKPGLTNFGAGEDGGDEVIIGSKLAAILGVRPGDLITLVSPNGDATAFGNAPVRKDYVVAATFTVGMSEYDQGFIYMPLSQSQLFLGRGQAVDFIEVKVAYPDKAPQMLGDIGRAANVPPDGVSDWTTKNAAFFNAVQVERAALRLILMIVIAIAALNIISGLIMLVKNKSRDIAILRTVGAQRGAIMRIFLMDGAAIGVIGTLTGLVLGILFCLNIQHIQTFVEWVTQRKVFNEDVYFLAHVPAKIDWGEVGLVSAFTLGISLLITLLPAWLASRTDPVEALRFE